MASDGRNRERLNPETWQRIGAVLDRVSGLDLRAHPLELAAACRAEGLTVDEVEPFLDAERRSDRFLDRLDVGVVDGALRGVAVDAPLPRFAAGERLGPYEIVAPVGAGGMGEVYEARDTRLGRTVALKLLTRELAARPEGRQRFEREARAISALNHPHVCTLYDVSHEEGVDFLVMERVQGRTLAARLQDGALSISETLQYAGQIADALAAAHRQGVVHRDLKPANVMITPRGVKLLDFGLAALRAREPVDGFGDATMTVEGGVLGTPAYMAPEQVHGRPADARTDIFALGAVMHEMLTGRRPFEAESTAGVIAAVLERDPDPASKYRADVPHALDWTIRTCFAKDPDERWQNVADVARQLQWINASGALPQSGTATPAERRRTIGWIASSVLIAVAVTAALTRTLWRDTAPRVQPQIARFVLPPPDGHIYDRMLALSPDGRRIAFVTTDPKEVRGLWVRAIDALTPQRLSGTDGASYPFWSPDGRFIGFFASSVLKKVELATGAVEMICKCDTGTGGGGTWNRDGVILFSKGLVVSPLWRVPASGGVAVAVTPAPQAAETDIERLGSNTWPQFLPDGRHFLWLTGGQGVGGVYVGTLDSTERKRVLEFPRGPRGIPERTRGWYSGGYLFFVQKQALMAQRFSPDRFDLTGDPVRVVEEVEQTAPGRSFFDVAAGVLAYREQLGERTRVRLSWFDRTGRETGMMGDPAPYAGLALSPDGRYVLASRGTGLVRIDTTSGIPSPVGLPGQSPVWAPDGSRFGLSGGRTGGPFPSIASFGRPEDVKSLDMRLLKGQAWASDWSPDGRYIVGSVLNAETLLDIWAVDVRESPMTTRYLVRAPGNQQDQRISPDGRWVAYASNERSENFEVYVRPFPEGPGTWRVSTTGGRLPTWTADRRELLYVSPDGTLMRTSLSPGREFNASAPAPLFRHAALQRGFNREAQFGRPYDLTDGRRILIAVPVSDPAPTPIVVILNWEQLLSGSAAR